jgi:hypothetical protein
MKYCSALSRNKILIHNPACMNTEDIMLSEIRHRSANTVQFHLSEVLRIAKSIQIGNRVVGQRK